MEAWIERNAPIVERYIDIRDIVSRTRGDTFKDRLTRYVLQKYVFGSLTVVRAEVSLITRYTLSVVFKLAARETSPAILDRFGTEPKLTNLMLNLVTSIDRFKRSYDAYMPLNLYTTISRLNDIPPEYEDLLTLFVCRRRRNMLRLLLVCLMDLQRDFGPYADPEVLIETVCLSLTGGERDLVWWSDQSYFQLIIEAQTTLAHKDG